MQALTKKSPNDGVNKFKLRLINSILQRINEFLEEIKAPKPFQDFSLFDEDNLPSNSDVVVIAAQYLACLEKVRSDNIFSGIGGWYWVIDGKQSDMGTLLPKKLQRG